MQHRTSEILPLTSLRFFAALWVFIFHVEMRWPIELVHPVQSIVRHGAAGMTLFFVLSGYVLAYNYSSEKIDVLPYLRNRFARIYPVYLVAAALTAPWFFLQVREMNISLVSAIGIIFANIFMVQAWFPPLFALWNDNGSWSLSAEAFFYVSFIFIMPYFCKTKRNIMLFICVYFLCVVSGSVFYLLGGGVTAKSLSIFYAMPIFRIGEFGAGILSYLYISRVPKINTMLFVFFGIMTLAVYFTINRKVDVYITDNFIVVPAICSIVIGFATAKDYTYRFLSNKVFVNLGRWSYCFYSFQAFILLVTTEVNARMHVPAIVIWVGSFLLLIIMSWAGFIFVEEPMRRKLKSVPSVRHEALPII